MQAAQKQRCTYQQADAKFAAVQAAQKLGRQAVGIEGMFAAVQAAQKDTATPLT